MLVAPGPARHKRHAAAACDAGVAVGRVHGALLVARQDRPYLLGVVKRVEDRQHDPARVAEQHVDPLELQRPHQRLRAGHAFTHDSTAPLSALETNFA